MTLAFRVGENQMWILQKLRRSVKSTYNQRPFPHTVALKHLILLPSTQLYILHSKLRQIQRISSTLFPKKIQGQRLKI